MIVVHSHLRIVIIDPDHDRLAAMSKALKADHRFCSRAFPQFPVALECLRETTVDVVLISSALLHDRESPILEELFKLQAHLCILMVVDEAQKWDATQPKMPVSEIRWPFSRHEFIEALQRMLEVPPDVSPPSAKFSLDSSHELR